MEQDWNRPIGGGVCENENIRVPGTRVARSLPAISHGGPLSPPTREVSEDGLQQLQHHLSKATQKCANRHVHQAMLVLQNMLRTR